MNTLNSEKLSKLQRNTSNIRNVCIMAHVDHGKTTLADSLVAGNGIISKKLAGKLRYMDSRKDEQERGITMKSSSITLYHSVRDEEYLVNLIDSPGHVDFSLEVSTAVRLCDGTIIVIDVVEGVCPQTQLALKLAWKEKLKPVLVLNKIDRLITEVKLLPLDAYVYLNQILEQVNAIMGDLFKSDIENQPDNSACNESKVENSVPDWSSGLEDVDDSELYFSPEQGNVVFASALDGWGFRIADFADVITSKYGFSKLVLQKTLWGDYYFHSKSKRVMKGAQEKAKKPLFVQFILENVWEFYNIIMVHKEKERYASIADKLNIKLLSRDLRCNDPRSILQTIFSKWLPLSKAVLDTVCEKCPSPNELSAEKVDNLMGSKAQQFYNQPEETIALRSSFLKCSSSKDAPLIIFISKMFPVDKNLLPENKQVPISGEEMKMRHEQAKLRFAALQAAKSDIADKNEKQINDREIKVENKLDNDEEPESVPKSEQALIAFARIYSGCITKGQEVFVLGPKHDPSITLQKLKTGYELNPQAILSDLNSDEHITKVCVGNLYLLMGRELEILSEVPAGNVLGIGGLEDHVLKSATLSSNIACPSFSELQIMATPIFRVAIEPKNPSDLQEVVRGLKLLNQADACVQVLIQETGELVIVTAGEVHLQKCIEDLEQSYANVPVVVSEPIIPFRETIIVMPEVDEVNEAILKKKETSIVSDQENGTDGIITVYTSNNQCRIKIKALPLPNEVTKLLEDNCELLKVLYSYTSLKRECNDSLPSCVLSQIKIEDDRSSNLLNEQILAEHTLKAIETLKLKLSSAFKTGDEFWKTISIENIWSFGPRNCGPNILLNLIPTYSERCIWVRPGNDTDNAYLKYDSSFLNGFQLATLAGPLCEEPMMGVCLAVLEWTINNDVDTVSSSPYGPVSGQIMYTVKECCKKAFQSQPQRLMAAMYSCNIQVNTEMLGKLYGVLRRRHGQILYGDMASGSAATFNVTATLPVAESFSFSNEIRKQTSGLANPQLVFSHWEVIDLDPFWKPSTEEEYLHFGEKADSENYARVYMNSVRRRKGLPVDEQIVEFAEKQRTLSKKK